MTAEPQHREPIIIEFAEPVTDKLYLGLAAAVMNLIDLAGMAGGDPITMSIDPRLDAALTRSTCTGRLGCGRHGGERRSH